MRIKHPKIEYGEQRRRKWFALWPVTIGDETRWLETVDVIQTYQSGVDAGEEWVDTKFLPDRLASCS